MNLLKKSTQAIGKNSETKAEIFLLKKGLKLMHRNYSCRLGEIDLIMRDGAHIVFIEVRSRGSSSHGGALASVDYWKQKKIIKTATYFLQKTNYMEKYPVRFDVVGLDNLSNALDWIKDAF